MIVIYYRDNNTGKITGYHGSKAEWSVPEIERRIDDFNKTGNSTAGYAVFPDSGIEAFLFNAANENKGCAREAVEDALRALDEARDCMEALKW